MCQKMSQSNLKNTHGTAYGKRAGYENLFNSIESRCLFVLVSVSFWAEDSIATKRMANLDQVKKPQAKQMKSDSFASTAENAEPLTQLLFPHELLFLYYSWKIPTIE